MLLSERSAALFRANRAKAFPITSALATATGNSPARAVAAEALPRSLSLVLPHTPDEPSNVYLTPTEWFRIAVVAATIAVGGSYWLIPYGSVHLPNALYGPGLGVVALLALVLRGLGILPFGRAVAIGLAVPSAVLVRVAFDVARDPTSHNLWPLEVAIALAVGMACTLPAALAGTLGARIRGTTAPHEGAP